MEFATNPLVSIVIPVYDVEPYLERCFNSILRQTYTNFEVIIVDDGSPDNSGQICDTFAQKDQRFHVFHQENAGVGAARNTGLSHVSGEWVMFVDSDDELFDNSLEIFVSRIHPETKMLIGGYVCCDHNGTITYQKEEHHDEQLSREEVIRLMYRPKVFFALCYIWIKLFKTEVIRQSGLQFDKTLKMNEDTVFSVQYLCGCPQGDVCHFFATPPIYKYYNTREGSATWQSNHDTSHLKAADTFIGNCKILESVKKAGIKDRKTLSLLKLSVYYRYHACIAKIREIDRNKGEELRKEYLAHLSGCERTYFDIREFIKRCIKRR